MTGRRNTIIAISAIVVFAAIVGFFITLDVSPQIAYARLFIDAGLVIGLVAVVMAFYRERELPCDSIVTAIKSIKLGKYKTRISIDAGPLSEIAGSLNELAMILDEKQAKQDEIKRSLREELLPNFKAKEPIVLEHSIHPELGPVHTINDLPVVTKLCSSHDNEPVALPMKLTEQRINNTLIGSNPPEKESIAITGPELPQDLQELYQRFIDAQRDINVEEIDFAIFLKTIEKTTEDLMASYQCHGVIFDVALDQNQVALQPKIIR